MEAVADSINRGEFLLFLCGGDYILGLIHAL